jgi:hypothetical protein
LSPALAALVSNAERGRSHGFFAQKNSNLSQNDISEEILKTNNNNSFLIHGLSGSISQFSAFRTRFVSQNTPVCMYVVRQLKASLRSVLEDE